MSHIFVSYSHTDKTYADSLFNSLTQMGFDVWKDSRIRSGERWFPTIVEAIKTCFAVIVVMTPEAEQSEWVEKEILIAQKNKKRILPLLLDGTGFSLLINIQHFDVRGDKLPTQEFYDDLEKIAPARKNIYDAQITLELDEATRNYLMSVTDGVDIGYARNPTNRQEMIVKIPRSIRSLHTLILGNAGTGKSTLLENLAIEDIKFGTGICVIDQQGVVINTLLKHIPIGRTEDLILVNLKDINQIEQLDFAELLNEQRILLVNLSSGKVQPQNSVLLGGTIIDNLTEAAVQSFRKSIQTQSPFSVYIDEFHHFVMSNSNRIAFLSKEGRKYGLSLTVTNQFLAPLSNVSDTWSTVLNNVGTLITFRTQEAPTIAKQFGYHVTSNILAELPNHHAVIQLHCPNCQPFEIKTMKK